MSGENKKGLETHFEQLEAIIHQMEEETVTLDQSFELYQKGIEEIKQANKLLDAVEKAMLVINAEGELEEF